jgi:hypothetical protein
MRAPDERFVRYTDAQWWQVEIILARIDILGTDAVSHLREELEHTARFYLACARAKLHRRTPKQRAQKLRDALAEIEAVRRRFEHSRILHPDDMAWCAPELAREACATLAELATVLKRNLDAVANADSRSSSNAGKGLRDGYWGQLAQLWGRIAGAQPRKLKVDFLLACSAPVFQDTSVKAINHFFDKQPKTSN